METFWLDPGSLRWLLLLKVARHDFYHLAGYVQLEAERIGGEARALLIEDGEYFFFLPMVVRDLRVVGFTLTGYEEAKDAISPYGYPAPLIVSPEKVETREEFLRAMLAKFKEEMASRGVVSAFIRLHPLLDTPYTALESTGVLVRHGETVWIDLCQDEEELWRQTRSTYRNLIRRLENEGVHARIDSEWEALPRFEIAYKQTMDAVKAQGHYYFGLEYFKKLRVVLGQNIFLCLVEDGNNIEAAGLFTECCGIIQYHLSGTDPNSHHKDATKLMLNFVRRWGKSRGNRQFHLGGGVGNRADSLFFFKSGFSKLRAPFYTYRVISNPEIYRAAERAWKERARSEPDDDRGFFPSYRKPFAV